MVRMAVPEAQSQALQTNMDVEVGLDAYNGKKYRGRIARMYPELDRRMRTRTAEVAVTDTVNLVPGMFARLSLKLESAKDTVVVPSRLSSLLRRDCAWPTSFRMIRLSNGKSPWA